MAKKLIEPVLWIYSRARLYFKKYYLKLRVLFFSDVKKTTLSVLTSLSKNNSQEYGLLRKQAGKNVDPILFGSTCVQLEKLGLIQSSLNDEGEVILSITELGREARSKNLDQKFLDKLQKRVE